MNASREYLAAARAEAEKRGLAGRVDNRYGDVVELADELPPADIVTVMHSLRRSPARYVVYRHRQVRGLMAEAEYAEIHDGGSPVWRVALYRRA